MQQRTLEQQIAEAEARLTRLRTQRRQLENGQKIILSGMPLEAARHDPKVRAWVIKEAGKAMKDEKPADNTKGARAFDGIAYRSKHGEDLDNWALFEPFQLTNVGVYEIAADDTDLQRALQLHRLRIA